MTRDDFEAQFWRAVTESREGRDHMAVRRILAAAEQYAESRATQVLADVVSARQGRERLGVATAEKYRRTA